MVGVAAAPCLPARVLATLQHELLALEAAVLKACPPAGDGIGSETPAAPTAPLTPRAEPTAPSGEEAVPWRRQL